MTNKEYSKMVDNANEKSNVLKDCFFAFLVGGLICVLGQALCDLYRMCDDNILNARALSSITLVAISIILTGLNIYPKIAKFAGAGTLVPITGFANACASPAIEFKPEGHVLGIGANIFKISGPVIVYGLFAGWIYGIFVYIMNLF
ncbi:MAG: SpoVA/SpoVAEb family sporulation membrane protein [Clostridia bacterium]|nr:SpoVA/SpoVAEb family sporulation membrane protein [Clostridia bacterium]